MKPRRRPFSGTLDSLLDTTTNAVGILVVVLVITQLGVRDAVTRIKSNLPVVSAEMLEAQRTKAEEIRQIAATVTTGSGDLTQQLADDQKKLDELKATVAALTPEAASAQELARKVEQQRAALAQQKQELQTVQTQLEAERKEAAALKEQLAAAPKVTRAPPSVVHLPNPREAAPGATPVYVVCKGERVLPVPLEGLRNLALARIRALRLPADDSGAVEGEPIVELFEKNDIGNRQFRLRVRQHNYVAHLVFEPREGAGDTIEAMHKPGSATAIDLHRANPQRQFARFLVWPDSFEAYLEARTVGDKAKLPAGWEPMHASQVFQVSLADAVRIRKPPPPPPPPAEPVKPAPPPPQPQPAPPPQPPPQPAPPVPPPRPPLPRDDID